MARTRQTARMSMGGFAPKRLWLGDLYLELKRIYQDGGVSALQQWVQAQQHGAHDYTRVLLEAAYDGADTEMLQQLLAAGADGWEALRESSSNNWTEAISALIEAGVDASATHAAADGTTVLHMAAEKWKADTVELLLEAGALVSAADNEGRTPLHLAAERCSEDGMEEEESRQDDEQVTKLLLRHGADACARDAAGRTPLLIVAQDGRSNITQLLLTHSTSTLPAADIAEAQQAAEAAGHQDTAALLAAALKRLGCRAAAAVQGSAAGGSSAPDQQQQQQPQQQPQQQQQQLQPQQQQQQLQPQQLAQRQEHHSQQPEPGPPPQQESGAQQPSQPGEQPQPGKQQEVEQQPGQQSQEQQQQATAADEDASTGNGRYSVAAVLRSIKAEPGTVGDGAAAATAAEATAAATAAHASEATAGGPGSEARALLQQAVAAGLMFPNQQQMDYFLLADEPFDWPQLLQLYTAHLAPHLVVKARATTLRSGLVREGLATVPLGHSRVQHVYPSLAQGFDSLVAALPEHQQQLLHQQQQEQSGHKKRKHSSQDMLALAAANQESTAAAARLLMALRCLQRWEGMRRAGEGLPLLLQLLLCGGPAPAEEGVVECVDLLSDEEDEALNRQLLQGGAELLIAKEVQPSEQQQQRAGSSGGSEAAAAGDNDGGSSAGRRVRVKQEDGVAP